MPYNRNKYNNLQQTQQIHLQKMEFNIREQILVYYAVQILTTTRV